MDTIINGKEVTRTKVVYTFDELSDKAKAVVVERERNNTYEALPMFGDIECDIKEHVIKELTGEELSYWGKHFTDLEVAYSLSHCQGDGVALYGRIYRNEAPQLNWADPIDYVLLKRNYWGNHYTHKNCFDLEFYNEDGDLIGTDGGSRNDIVLYLSDNNWDEAMKPTLFGTSDKDNMTADQLAVHQSMTNIMNDLKNLCVTSERVGYATIDNLTSEETILEKLQYDDMPRKYDADGQLTDHTWWE